MATVIIVGEAPSDSVSRRLFDRAAARRGGMETGGGVETISSSWRPAARPVVDDLGPRANFLCL